MKQKLSNGTSAHSLSNDELLDMYKTPLRKKDRAKIVAVLKSRGVTAENALFLRKLKGEKPLEVGETVYAMLDSFKPLEKVIVAKVPSSGSQAYAVWSNKTGLTWFMPAAALFRKKKEGIRAQERRKENWRTIT